MSKDKALTLESLRVMDTIDRRKFAAAAEELGRVPSALSYTIQKLEEELDVVLFDRSPVTGQNSLMSGGCCWSAVACCWKRRIN